MTARTRILIVVGAALMTGGVLIAQHGVRVPAAIPSYSAAGAAVLNRAGLPSEDMAKQVLSDALAHRHPQYLDMRAGDTRVRSFVVFPERADNSPVLVITANNQGMSDWLRAVGDSAAAAGFIAVVPDAPVGDLQTIEPVARSEIATHAAT